QDVVVQPGQVAATGVQLSVGATSESVTVMAANSQLIDTTSVASSSNVDSKTISALPNRQSVNTLALLSPGVISQQQKDKSEETSAAMTRADSAFSMSGGGLQLIYTLDGQSNNDIGGRAAITPRDPGTIQSLQVLGTTGYNNANRASGSSINVVTRSGSNNFHGGILGYDLDRRWGAMSPLERRSGLNVAPAGSSALFGFSLGGPIRRDRLFFFGSLQAESGNSGLFADSTSSSITPTSPGLARLSQAFPQSPTVRDMAARRLQSDPLGNMDFFRTFVIPVLGTPIEFGEIIRIVPSHTSAYQGTGRVDLNLTPRDTLQGSYWFQNRNATGSVGRLAAGYPGDLRETSQLTGIHWTRLLSPRSTNEVSVGFNRARAELSNDGDGFVTTPSINIGLRGLSFGASPLVPQSHISTLFQVGDTLTLARGRHTITVGGQLLRRITHLNFLSGPVEQIYYQDYDAFVLARPFNVTVAEGNPGYPFSETGQFYFADDRWRLTDSLTLSFGLGYQNPGDPIEGLGERLLRREAGPAPLFDRALPVGPRTITRPDRNNHELAPRVGFAYAPRMAGRLGGKLLGLDRTIIRGGAAISYDAGDYQSLADIQASAPNSLMAVLGPSYASQFGRPSTIIRPGELESLIGRDPRAYATVQLSPDFRPSYATRWHLSVGRNIDDRITIEAAYVGSRGFSLIRAADGMPQLTSAGGAASGTKPVTGLLRIYESSGQSIYHGLQTHAEFRFQNNLTGGLSYTFSKMIDDVPDSIVSPGAPIGTAAALATPALQDLAQNPFDSLRGERARSSLDRRHNLVADFVWSIPVKKSPDGLAGRLLVGWQT